MKGERSVGDLHPDRQAEQEHLDYALKLREERRAALGGGLVDRAYVGGRGVWDSASPASAALEGLGPVDSATAFGRIDLEDETFHIGRISIFDAEKEPVVINWKTPVGGLFYSANVNEPGDVLRKRTFALEDDPTGTYLTNTVVDLTDDDYSSGDAGPSSSTGDHLLRELARSRSGEMREIVATIQSHQYALIAATADRPVLIQGGPGTGKTAVALHRVSWLLHNRRERGWRPEDVLVVGPTKAFTRYIRRVLPTLGDQGVVQLDLAGLAPKGPNIDTVDSPSVAALKGEPRMIELLNQAVDSRIVISEKAQEISWKTARVRFPPETLREYVSETRPAGYARGRDRFALRLLEDMNEARGLGTEPAERNVVARLVDKIWPALTPAAVLRDLLGSERRLAHAAGDSFTAAEVLRLYRKPAERISTERFSISDAALLDELEFILSPDRVARFKHVVVDEAQDLTPMQLRAIERRVSDRSITLLGDLAQSTGPSPLRSWDRISSAFGPVEFAEMTVGYRIPAEISDFASSLVPRIAPGLDGPTAIRVTGNEPSLRRVDPEELIQEAAKWVSAEASPDGSIALIAHESSIEPMAAELTRSGVEFRTADDEPGAMPMLLTARGAKGLEFDHVCVVGSEQIAKSGLADLRALYVAYTRPTTTLTVFHSGDPLAESVGIEHPSPDVVAPGETDSEVHLNPGRDEARAHTATPQTAPAALPGHEQPAAGLVALGRLIEFGGGTELRGLLANLSYVRAGRAALSSIPPDAQSVDLEQADGLLDGRVPASELTSNAALTAGCWVIGLLRSGDPLDPQAEGDARVAAGKLLRSLRGRSDVAEALRIELERALLA